jgi:hypothetical protein
MKSVIIYQRLIKEYRKIIVEDQSISYEDGSGLPVSRKYKNRLFFIEAETR